MRDMQYLRKIDECAPPILVPAELLKHNHHSRDGRFQTLHTGFERLARMIAFKRFELMVFVLHWHYIYHCIENKQKIVSTSYFAT